MSFSADVKNELTEILCENDCCKRAMAYGILFFGREFSADAVSILTEHKSVADRYAEAVCYITGSKVLPVCSKSGKYTVSVNSKDDCIDILNEFGYTGKETSFRLNSNNIENECCLGAFMRGAFLSCGIITDPQREYHLEFAAYLKSRCTALSELLCGFEVQPKITQRNGSYIMYFKDSEQIVDILALMGASKASLNMITTKIYKDIRNSVNRQVNCEKANLSKTCDAAVSQTKAISKIIKLKGLGYLPPHLRELAKLRIENPDMSLSTLGASLSTPLSRSGVNHRLKKIEEIAKELE